jgi:energy-coupling factor transporter transmembrane protein EcfT
MRVSAALRTCDARVKLTAALAALVLAIASRQPTTPLLLAACALACVLTDGEARHRLAHALGALAITAGIPVALLAYWRGPEAALLAGARVLAASTVAGWLVAFTPLDRLQSALVFLRVPAALVELLGLAWRYAAVLKDTLVTARDAQALRLGWATRSRALRSSGTLAGVVFGRAIDQTSTLADAMALRGHQGRARFAQPSPLGSGEALIACGCLLALGLSAAAGVLL